jgi:hypothetical protein
MVLQQGEKVGPGTKPAGKSCFRDVAFHLGQPVLQVIGQAKKDGVPETDVGDLVDDLPGAAVAYLKGPPGIDPRAQINTHSDHAVLSQVIVPGVVMAAARDEAIHPARKASDPPAPRYFFNELEQPDIIHEKE